MVVVTHYISFARHVADHIVFMDQGKIIEKMIRLLSFRNSKEK
ncbi:MULTISPECIES: hypothetical protein [Aerococcus]|uniref:ABC transporter ATP-binding protein n=1 Tax=Aerococcus mictus TaxID=2976810 RepID=A0A9Q4DEL9_9LACT|nr:MULTISPECIES: hypothetical protein [Aerococcus]MCY3034427.1 hypothetical protein [Aerococcus mictus]MCY3063732.1 hypothetical protein [Aerococcus mictus]MCY3065558.1 hypothetical protein [Aerococcus mictus]MCY3067098.1 hypothetical protein [Aerococcus mictus]MCY3068611.1 hypothetical protein [Aerococcus mictus]